MTGALALAVCVLSEHDNRPQDPGVPSSASMSGTHGRARCAGDQSLQKQIVGILIAVFLVGYSTTQLEPLMPLYLSGNPSFPSLNTSVCPAMRAPGGSAVADVARSELP